MLLHASGSLASQSYRAQESGALTYVVVHKLDLWQREGVVEAHEDGRLHKDVDEVHDLVPEEEGRRP